MTVSSALVLTATALVPMLLPLPRAEAATVTCQGGNLYGGIAFNFNAFTGACASGFPATQHGASFLMYYSNIGPQFYFNNPGLSISSTGGSSPGCTLFNVYPTDPNSKNLYISTTAATCTNDISYTDPYGNPVSFTHVSSNLVAQSFSVTYTPVPAPTITSIVGSPIPTLGGTSVTINGSYLLFPTVTIGGVAATVTSTSATAITVTAPARPAGVATVVVTVPNGSASSSVTYTTQPQAPLNASASPSTLTFGSGTSTLSATGGSGTGAITYAVASGPCTVSGATLSSTGAGSCSVTATKAADANYNAATSAPISVTVNAANQTALVASASPSTLTFGSGTSALSTTGGSGTGAVSYTVASGPCTVSGSTLSTTGAGSCTVTATKAADANYNATTSAAIGIIVNRANQAALTAVATPASITVGNGSTLSATGGSGTGVLSYAVTAGASFCSNTGNWLVGNAVGTCTATVTKAADTNYNAASATVNITVGPQCMGTLVPNTIGSFTYSPSAQSFGVASQFHNCLGGNIGPNGTSVTYTSSVTTPGSATSVAGGANTYYGQSLNLNAGLAPGSYSMVATYTPDSAGRYAAAVGSATVNFTVGKANQAALTATATPSTLTFGSGTSALSTSGGSGTGAVTYNVASGPCTVSGATLSTTGAGTCSITASKATDTNYNAATSSPISVTVNPAAPGALILSVTPSTLTFGGGTSALSTTGGNGTGAISYAVASGPCSVSGATLSASAAGTCSVTATQAADANYTANTSAPVSVTINQAAQAISFTAPPSQTYTPGGTVTLSATGGASGNPVTFASTTSSVCTVSGTTATMVTAGTCSITASQAGNTNYAAASDVSQSFAIGQAAQTISFTAPPSQTYSPGGTVMLSATGGASGNPVTFASTTTSVCTVSGTTATMVTAGTCSITASQAGNSSYAAATDVSQSFAIGQATQTISFTKPADQTFTVGGTVPLVASGGASGNPVTFASTTAGVCSVSGATATIITAGTCSVTASQAGNTSYSAASDVSQSFAIGKASQTIAFAKPADQTFFPGSTMVISGTATSSLVVTFASTTTSVCTTGGTNGTTVTMVAPGACSITASQPGDANYAAATNVTQTFGINQITTTLSLSASSTTSTIGQPVTYTATVSTGSAQVALASGSLGGTVTFTSGATTMCSNVALSGNSATCSYAFPNTGAHTVMAQYSGSGSFASATSSAMTLAATDNTVKTVQTISRFMGQRGNAIVSNGFDGSRQIDRLAEADRAASGSSGGAGFSTSPSQQPSRLGAGPDANDLAKMRFGGSRGRGDAQAQLESLGFRGAAGEESDARGNSPYSAGDPNTPIAAGERFAFATSLSKIRQMEAGREAAKLNQLGDGIESLQLGSGAGAKPRYAYSPFDLWVEGKYGGFRDDQFDAGQRGHFGLLTFGADYVLNRYLLVGAFLQLDSMRQHSGSDTSLVEGTGWMAGPYATVRLDKNLYWQSRAAWGTSSNEISPVLTYVDKFETSRWLASTSLTGRYHWGDVKVQPSISATYFEDKSDSYVDGLGVTIPSVSTQFGQIKAGPSFSRSIETSSGVIIEPSIATNLIWNFASETTAGAVAGLDGLGSGPEGVRGQVEVGMKALAPSGVSLDFGVSYDGIGSSDYNAVTGRAGMRFPLN